MSIERFRLAASIGPNITSSPFLGDIPAGFYTPSHESADRLCDGVPSRHGGTCVLLKGERLQVGRQSGRCQMCLDGGERCGHARSHPRALSCYDPGIRNRGGVDERGQTARYNSGLSVSVGTHGIVMAVPLTPRKGGAWAHSICPAESFGRRAESKS